MENNLPPTQQQPKVVYIEEPQNFTSAVFGLLIVVIIISVIVWQHYVYDELRFSMCKKEITSPVAQQQ